MKWFKHENTFNNPKIMLLTSRHGAVAYGAYFMILELLSENIEPSNIEEWGFLPETYSKYPEILAQQLKLNKDELEEILASCYELDLFELRDNRLYCGKIIERCDRYTELILKQKDKNTKDLPQDVHKIQKSTPRIEENRREKKRLEENRKDYNSGNDDSSESEIKNLPNGMSHISKVLESKYSIPPRGGGISKQFQEKAFRYADKLGVKLEGSYKSRWLKVFKDESEGKKSVWSTDQAYSYLSDYTPPEGSSYTNEAKIKYFFWLIANGNQDG